jgi:HEPN domain-containing protein
MPKRENVSLVVREWVEKAENDLKNAAHTLLMNEDCPTDTVCYHAQQCAEKYLKALLVANNIPFPKTHDLEELHAIVPRRYHPLLDGDEQSVLTDYATGARYPGWCDISLAEARKAVAMARKVRRKVRRFLPKVALCDRGKAPPA